MLLKTTLLLSFPIAVLADTCTINSGVAGTCIVTVTCSDQGGKSEAGHCAGPTDIQCCTYGTCNNNGVAGTCQPTSTCTRGKTTTAKYIPSSSLAETLLTDCLVSAQDQQTSNAAPLPHPEAEAEVEAGVTATAAPLQQ